MLPPSVSDGTFGLKFARFRSYHKATRATCTIQGSVVCLRARGCDRHQSLHMLPPSVLDGTFGLNVRFEICPI